MSDFKPYVGDENTAVEVDMQEDLTSWTNLKFYVKKAKVGGGTEEIVVTAAQKAGTGNEQILQYIIGSGTPKIEFDVSGRYHFQPYGEISGWKGKGDTISFLVYSKFK